MTRCAEALARNESLEVLKLPYSLWDANSWKIFFAMLPKNRHLKKLQVVHYARSDYETLQTVLESLEETGSCTRVCFRDYVQTEGINLMNYTVFSSIKLSGNESMQVDASTRLPFLNHFTCLSLDVFNAGERLFSALAKYIRQTTVLWKLLMTLADHYMVNNTATPSCWTLLFESMSVHTSIADLNVFGSGSFQYSDRLTSITGLSKCITRLSFRMTPRDRNATELVTLLSKDQ
ncbi:hypothetical protein HPB51_024974 [Rhipicephalus microplus]|uniref:Uncharacterized protein n=1 Tax=Rhipicephalus microplus TaxID=6941 RepID=A0A9J6EV51_RHIMP|nr:hypothetical protein HPB51_024974 [Rhipicephalus microplus]